MFVSGKKNKGLNTGITVRVVAVQFFAGPTYGSSLCCLTMDEDGSSDQMAGTHSCWPPGWYPLLYSLMVHACGSPSTSPLFCGNDKLSVPIHPIGYVIRAVASE